MPEVVSETFIWTGAKFCYWQTYCCRPLKLGVEFANAVFINRWLLNWIFRALFWIRQPWVIDLLVTLIN